MIKIFKLNKNTFYKAFAVLFAIAIWQIASSAVNAQYLLASPLNVIKRLIELITEADFIKTVVFSFLRITAGFLYAFILGILFAVLSGKYKLIEYLLWPYIISVKAVPIASIIILFLLWLNYTTLTVIIAFLIAFPVIYTNVLQGIRNADKDLSEVAALYNVPFSRRLLYIYIPSIKPFIISACAASIGMAWKAGVAAEVIGVIKGSIGEKLYNAKVYFENADLLAWTVVIIILSFILEKLFMFILKTVFRRIEKI